MEKTHLNVLWTNADPITSEHMVMLYTENAIRHNWWDKVTIIIWGATSKLVAENSDIQRLIKQGQEVGVEYVGCLYCAQQLKVDEKLRELGVDLKYMGVELTEIIKGKNHLITV
jgi:hypothetical protein